MEAYIQVTTDDLIGIPFKDGGRNKAGYDCWGLVCEVFRRIGIELPDYKISCEDASRINQEISIQRKEWRRCEGPIPVPALVVIRFNEVEFCNHTGVYIGNGRFIHTREKIGVNIDRIDSPAWKRKIEGYYVPGWPL
jgi:cell wall-associated NlpC family hydrolase